MKRIQVILTVFMMASISFCAAQDVKYEDLYGFWVDVEREAEIQKYGPGPYDLPGGGLRNFGENLPQKLMRRRSLFIEAEGLIYIPGGLEVIDKVKFASQGFPTRATVLESKAQFRLQSTSFVHDTLHLSVTKQKSKNPDQLIQIIMLDQETAVFKIEDNIHTLKRIQTVEFLDYCYLFGLKKYLPENSEPAYLYDLKESIEIPTRLIKKHHALLRVKDMSNPVLERIDMAPTQIKFGKQDWQVIQSFHFDSCWMVLTYDQVSNQQRFFIFTETDQNFEYSIVDPGIYTSNHSMYISKS